MLFFFYKVVDKAIIDSEAAEHSVPSQDEFFQFPQMDELSNFPRASNTTSTACTQTEQEKNIVTTHDSSTQYKPQCFRSFASQFSTPTRDRKSQTNDVPNKEVASQTVIPTGVIPTQTDDFVNSIGTKIII